MVLVTKHLPSPACVKQIPLGEKATLTETIMATATDGMALFLGDQGVLVSSELLVMLELSDCNLTADLKRRIPKGDSK